MRTLEQALEEDTGAHTERASELVSIRSDAGRWQHRMSQRPVDSRPPHQTAMQTRPRREPRGQGVR
jgi:hypothetical protein